MKAALWTDRACDTTLSATEPGPLHHQSTMPFNAIEKCEETQNPEPMRQSKCTGEIALAHFVFEKK
jgi:hypothetical protein